MKKIFAPWILILSVLSGCATMQSLVKSTFPYTASIKLPENTAAGTENTVISNATSFDQNFANDGNTGEKVSQVHIVAARLESIDPSVFNFGNITSAKLYLAKSDGSDETLVAQRNDISPDAGNNLAFNITDTHFLDKYLKSSCIRVRMVYVTRNKLSTDTDVKLSLAMSAFPAN